MKKSVEAINKISWSILKEYTAQVLLIHIYTRFFFVCFQLFCSFHFLFELSAIKGRPRPSRCSGYNSFIHSLRK